MTRYAIVESGNVVNVVIWDGESECKPLEGAIELPVDSPVSVGYTYRAGEYFPPPIEVPAEGSI
ncbi:hypothetical protein PBR20603_01490 [Pandoraea bronchicola]|uniref:Uncharacterized protein n=1 Tax=Pandoraea bronchicola TaxID=2508287 RepID=A0A5E5BPH5_9BURK|nr:hypothetical protein PBR20603_01490 [Pandoraea bronchicola]